MDEFTRDLQDNLRAIEDARRALVDVVGSLSDDDLARGRRGGWTIGAVLRHVIDSDVAYAKVVGFLRSQSLELANATDDDVATPAAATRALERSRAALLERIDGIDEATFYDLRSLGKEQYSVVSVLENIAMHDHEHLEQIDRIRAAG